MVRRVELVWASQEFQGFRVSDGWPGHTREGIQLGDTREQVLDVYPDFEPVSNREMAFGEGANRVFVLFDGNDRLAEIIVGYYRYN